MQDEVDFTGSQRNARKHHPVPAGALAQPRIVPQRDRSRTETGGTRRCIGLAVCAGIGLLGSASIASASLIGAQVTYRSLFPNTQTVLDAGGTQVVTPLTTFTDTQNGLTSFFIGNKLVVENTSPLAFAAGTFNGPQLSFGGGGLTGATVDPVSSPDFAGAVAFTGTSVMTNYQALTPALGSTETIDLTANTPLAGQQVGYQYFVPTAANLQENPGTTTLATGTYFLDGQDGITVAIGADTLTIINNVPLAFASGTFNGLQLVFSGVNILGATIDPISAADFLGTVSTTADTIAINFSGLAPTIGHAVVIDVRSTIPEPGPLPVLLAAMAALVWLRRRPRSDTPDLHGAHCAAVASDPDACRSTSRAHPANSLRTPPPSHVNSLPRCKPPSPIAVGSE